MTKQRGAAIVIITAIITVSRYALIAETALQVAAGANVAPRAAVIAVLTVTLWFLNGVGIVALVRWWRART